MTRNRSDLSRRLIAAATRTGGPAGRDAADWWAQDTIGGRAPADRAADNARRILAGLDNGDPATYDTLPTPTPEQVIDAYDNQTPPIGPDWPSLPAADRDTFDDAYASAYTDAVHTRITRLCRLILAPADQPRATVAGLHVPDRDADWSHLHPDRLRVGRIGVFAGDWSYYQNTDGQMRIPVGFVGVLVDTWNGWAVFRCDRDVAEAIVTEQQRIRGAERDRLAATGLTGHALDQVVDECVSDMFWDGDQIVTDNRTRYGEPDAYERTGPDEHGSYIVNGWDWTWTAVDPDDCDHIAGTLPTADATVAFVPLVHRDASMPHGRFTVTSDRDGYLLRLDTKPVAQIHDIGRP